MFRRCCVLLLLSVPLLACGRDESRPHDRKAAERAHTAQPNVHVLAPLHMPTLDRERTLRIYLPPSYENGERRYPVLYMHDGQNLFDDATSYVGEWGVDETLNELARTKKLELIVVGIDHGELKRMTELNAWESEKYGKGEGREYMSFVVDVVKPYIDAHYRTLPDREHTALMGSSLGGLISHFAMYEYPRVFSKIGIFSPAYWIAPPVQEFTRTHALPEHTRVYFYAGGKEGDTMLPDMQAMVEVLRGQGVPAQDLRVAVDATAQHNEKAWRAEFPRAIEWLFDGVR
jgi:predicted alpha/beta superfamily hydrolase